MQQTLYETDQAHLERLAVLNPGESANVRDLADYVDDLHYREIQASLLVHALPFCLRSWHEYLRNKAFECPGFAQHFYTVLEKKDTFAGILTDDQRQAVWEFMSGAILEEIDAQDCLRFEGYPAAPYRWIRALMTHGVIAPDIEHLWMDWWSVSTIGRAVATVQYVSCLVYPKDANPVFAPRTRERGGGPPCLWEFDGYSNDSNWKIQNVEFLQKAFRDPKMVIEVIQRAVERLAPYNGFFTAQQLLTDSQLPSANLKLRSPADTLAERLLALPEILTEPRDTYLWPD